MSRRVTTCGSRRTRRRNDLAGFTNADHVKKDSDLDPLRDRADFQQPLADLITTSAHHFLDHRRRDAGESVEVV